MALTDTRPESETEVETPSSTAVPLPVSLLGSGDHKAIGLVYVGAALLWGAAFWVLTALAGAHTLGDGNFLTNDGATTMFQLGRLGLVLMVMIPLMLGLATYIVPLQVGANTVAFPRAASAALWTWFLSGGVLVVASAIDGGIGGTRAEAVDLGLLALIGLVASLLLGSVCVVTTAIALRTPGMSLDRVPFFTWASLVGTSIWLLTLPALLANVVLIYVDLHYGRPSDFGVAGSQWAQISWLVGQPQVYTFMIPGLGIISDVVATLVGVRQPNRGVLLTAIGAFGVLSIGSFAQPYFYPDAPDELLFAAMSVLILVVVLALVAGWAATMLAGKPSTKSPLGLAVVSMLLLLLGAAAGVLYVITPLELRETTIYTAGQFALVAAAVLAAGVAGLMYWAPKMTGRAPAEGLGKLNVLVLLGGGVLAGLPLIVLGFATKYDGLADAADTLNGISVAGDALLALGAVITLFALLSTARGARVEDDAWGTGQTLEWSCPSPPPTGNFGELPVIVSAEPLLDASEPSEEA